MYSFYRSLTRPYTTFTNFFSVLSASLLFHSLSKSVSFYNRLHHSNPVMRLIQTPAYKLILTIGKVLSLLRFDRNPWFRRACKFIWTYKVLLTLIGIHLTYLFKWRYEVFIDRKNKTLYTHTHL